ncbi:MAG: pyridoxamine 5'-phosphate oxidase [Rhodothermales bacterium]|nr:pyridoxamine 5'-phosphate oxidase [Rhodothermales bacterium]
MPPNVADLRRDYRQQALDEAAAAADPFTQFERWFGEAVAGEQPEPNAMTLATATPDGRPSARIVLLKGVEDDAFVFFTNYRSRKAEELAANPHAALVFWWHLLERQVRVEGRVEPLAPEASDAYHRSRPRGSQLGAWASPQSHPLATRAALTDRLAEVTARFDGQAVPRPPHWGGYRLLPHTVEFWQGRPSRLHDRLRYRRADGGDAWRRDRLAP